MFASCTSNLWEQMFDFQNFFFKKKNTLGLISSLQIFQLLQQKIVIQTFLCVGQSLLSSVCIHVECIPNIRVQEIKLIRQDQYVSSISSTWDSNSSFFQPFQCHPRIPKRIDSVLHEQKTVLSPIQAPAELPRSVFPTKGLRVGDRTDVRSRGTTGSSMLANDFGHLCRGRRIHIYGHSDFGILSNLGASSIFT